MRVGGVRRPRAGSVVVRSSWTTVRSRRGRVLRSSRVKPGVFKGRATLVLRRDRTLGRHEWLVVLLVAVVVVATGGGAATDVAAAAVVTAEPGG